LKPHLRFYSHSLLLALFLAFSGISIAQTAPEIAPADSQRYLADVKTLTTPEMEGRGDGTKGLVRAENLIVERYKKLGLEPAGTKGYLQPFPVAIGRRLKGENRLSLSLISPDAEGRGHLNLGEEYVPLNISGTGVIKGLVVFAGYGITAPELSYDDYQGLDATGKIVLVLRDEPPAISEKAVHGGKTRHAELVTKAINARNHGATAMILVNGKLGKGEEDLLMKFGDANGPEDVGIPCVQLKRRASSDLLPPGASLDDLQKELDHAAASGTSPSHHKSPEGMSATMDGIVEVETIRATVNNVLAYLPGKTDEYVIVGAHYDHLGRGGAHSLAPSQTGTIHPGADDNASGTAGVLELARLFAAHKGEMKRGILFMNFAGEELGLLGSAAWVNAPTKPLDKAVAMLNMDMIGRIKDGKVFVGGVGTGTTLKAMLDEAKSGTKFEIEPSESGYSSSDHTSFVGKKVPVLFFFSGLHSDYHKPSDTWDKINADAAAQLLDLVGRVDVELANAVERPLFVAVAENPHAGGVSSGGGYGPYFGSVPDFGENKDGVKFSDVRPGSPAAKAGLQAGDVLTQFGEKAIHNLYDFTDALRRSKVGDVVEVTVLRDGKPMKVRVTLEQRK
jgi:hypothetical protein